ncbi:long-chain fatty alcohol dehydrogenase [Trichodelitschia bisporula]|uniref:Long-chain-alcohol oxidase n=1 Tax=Trichodelitschia bisporula TaxID=703511 RepID=A0A6G1HK16_9PEZI|nr:long-chain fatty alcohol dehydrogenase [Trichodelitschia bisporula]
MIKSSPLPPVGPLDPLSEDNWRTLLAFADAVIPSIRPASTSGSTSNIKALPQAEYATVLAATEANAAPEGKSIVKQFLEERPSDNPAFKEQLYRWLAHYTPPDQRKQLALGLAALNYRIGALLMTGYTTPFADQPIPIRESIIKSWSTARLPVYRLLFKQLTLLCKQNWIFTSPSIGPVLGFPRTPLHGEPAPGFDHSFVQIPPGEGEEVLEADVVIVGSGCGGAVCAKNLSEAGYKVLVVDKAYHWPAEHFPMTQVEGFSQLFMSGGAILSDDGTSAVVAGQAWGGGGTVNWSASLQTQGFVRQEWADAGLPFFTSAEYQACMDRVCARMGVSASAIEHNKSNAVLLEGARKLGWAAGAVPQNTNGKKHYCGYCSLGCGAGEKQGPVVSWLPDAAGKGAVFVEGYEVDKILFETRGGKKTAVGVTGSWTSRDSNNGVAGADRYTRKLTIRAKRVIASAGSMSTPLLLHRSGLRNPHIGRNLMLHPVTFLGASYPSPIHPWEGPILTAVVSSFENLDGHGHGAKLEAVSMMPSGWLAFQPWAGGAEYKEDVLRMRRSVGQFAIARDEGPGGRVYADPVDGRTRFTYVPSKADRRHLLEGIVGLAKINYVAGATEMWVTVPGVSRFVRGEPKASDIDQGINDPAFQTWLQEVRARGLPDPDTLFMSAHQMGSCRMGASPKQGAVDAKGKSWEAEGLYVADASVFPSASGVNPMVTNMAIADWISGGVGRGLAAGGAGEARL